MNKLMIATARSTMIHCALFGLLIASICAIVAVYVSNEHKIYFWDDAAYHDMTLEKAIYFRDLSTNSYGDLLTVLRDIWSSTARDYSDLHTLLIIPFVLTFGESRLVYILSIALVYLLPFVFINSAIASNIISYRSQFVFWASAFLILAIPSVWSPTLHGYPDTGSAALIGAATLLYLYDLRLRRWWRMLLIGLCIGLAILFRRHFIYDGITFFAAVSIQAIIISALQFRYDRHAALKYLFQIALRIVLAGTSIVITLVILGWPFVDRLLHTDFGQLYASYAVSSEENVVYYISQYGWLTCILAVIGFGVALWRRSLLREPVAFITICFGISWMQWMISVRQLGFHYTLHFTLYITLGMLLCIWFAWSELRKQKRFIVLTSLGLLFIMNAVVGLSPIKISSNTLALSYRYNLSASGLFPINNKPVIRADYNEIVRLVDYLRSISSPDEPIYVAASSAIINDDIIWHAERSLYENVIEAQPNAFWENKELNVLHWVPFADSRDSYPLEKLLLSQYVVIATPFQYHMHPDQQEVLNVVVDAFQQDWELSQDFVRLPEEFLLEGQVSVQVYKRIRPTSLETTIRTLEDMEDYVGDVPGGQLSWIGLSQTPGYYIKKNRDGTYNIILDVQAVKAPVTSFLYINDLPDRAVVTGTVGYSQPQCGAPSISLLAIDANGRKMSGATYQSDGANKSTLSLSVPIINSAYLLLDIAGAPTTDQPGLSCWISVHNLALSK